MKRQFFLTAASLAGVLMLGASTYAAPMTLVSDNFDNAQTTDSLHGRTPDSGPGNWVVNPTAARSTLVFRKDGADTYLTTTYNGGDANNAESGFLPITPDSYATYTLSADFNLGATNAINHFDVAFTNGVNSFYLRTEVAARVTPDGKVSLQGVGSTAAASTTLTNFDATADHTLKLVYQASDNKAAVYLDNSQVIGFTEMTAATGKNGTMPSIANFSYGAFLFLGSNAQLNGQGDIVVAPKMDNFSVTAVPEPGTLSLLGLGGLLLVRRRK